MIVQLTKDTLSLLHNQLTCLDRPCCAGQTRKTADPWKGFGFLANLKKRPWHIFQESRSLLWRFLCKREAFLMYKRRKTKIHPYFSVFAWTLFDYSPFSSIFLPQTWSLLGYFAISFHRDLVWEQLLAILADMKKPSASDQKPARLLRSKFTSSFVAGGGDVRLTRKHSGNGPRTATECWPWGGGGDLSNPTLPILAMTIACHVLMLRVLINPETT